MERLTEKRFAEKGYYLKCSEMCKEMNCSFCEHDSDALDKLGEYEDAEESGILLRLPCKVGDTVYRIEVGCCEYREKDACAVYCDGYDYACPDYKADRHLVVGHFSLNDIASLGKTVFLTLEEAEAALAKEA